MQVKHHGHLLSPQTRSLKPTPQEQARGVESVTSFEYWCPEASCRKRLFYRQDVTSAGPQEMRRIRSHERAAFVARLRRAKDSDWVWGFHPETFAKVKRTVR